MDPPQDITLPQGSTATLRAILSAGLRRLLSDLRSMGVDTPTRAVLSALKDQLGRAPGPVFAALRRPTVGVLIRVLRRRLEDGHADPLWGRLAPTLAAELAAAGATLPALRFEAPSLACLGCGRVLPGGDVELVDGTWRTGGLAIDLRAPTDDLPRVIDGIRLGLVDDNPLAMDEAHPDKAGNAVDLGDRPVEAWLEALRDAIGIVETYAPLLREELSLVIHQLVPVGFDAAAHLSASYQESIGTIYLTLHPDEMTMAEAIVHEMSHNKLNALLELDPLLVNAFSPLYTSPVRPDPRPLHGVLLAVHAFLPIEALYRRMTERGDPRAQTPEFARRFDEIVQSNRQGAEVLLVNAEATAVGQGLLDEIARLAGS